tara:strand:+ start:165 stop:344 length:180 start_codon:yes stop_codon:yes gene_type:complete
MPNEIIETINITRLSISPITEIVLLDMFVDKYLRIKIFDKWAKPVKNPTIASLFIIYKQ